MSADTTPDGGVGITLSYGTVAGGNTTYTPLLLIKDDAEFSGIETAKIELKTLVSGTIDKVPGRTDPGDFTASSYFVPGDPGVAKLWALAQAKTRLPWQVMFNDGSTRTTVSTAGVITLGTGSTFLFNGFVATITPGGFTGEDAPSMDFEIAISGSITFTPGS